MYKLPTRQYAPYLNINLLLLSNFQGEMKCQRLTLASSSPKPKFLTPLKFRYMKAYSVSLTDTYSVSLTDTHTAPAGDEVLPIKREAPTPSSRAQGLAGPAGLSPGLGDGHSRPCDVTPGAPSFVPWRRPG